MVSDYYESPAVAKAILQHYGDAFSERLGDVRYYDSLVRDCGAGCLLEVGCGFGRVSVALARPGLRVQGVDRSVLMIDLARKRARDKGVAEFCEFRVGDARDLPEVGEMDLILAPFRVFECLLGGEDERAFLQSCGGLMSKDSMLLLHVLQAPEPRPGSRPEIARENKADAPAATDEGIRLLASGYDSLTHIVSETWELAIQATPDQPEIVEFAWRWSTPADTADRCRSLGFHVSLERAPFGESMPGANWLIQLTLGR